MRAYRRMACGICLCVWAIILTAGLWPFHVPINQVQWLKGGGLAFGRHGSAVTSEPIRENGAANASATLEIWLEPAASGPNSTILSFDGSAHPGEPFSLRQRRSQLSIRRNNVDDQGVSRTALVNVDGVFEEGKPVFLTVALDAQGTSVYVNGVLAKASPLSGTWNDFTGRLVLANSPADSDSWSGRIFGLAIYQRELTASEIAANYASWMTKRKPVLAIHGSAAALYLFDERGGVVAHNALDPAAYIAIPAHYFLLHPRFLRAPWREDHATWGYWRDAGINIAGFIPFGFCIFTYLSLIEKTRRPAATTIVLGFLTSVTIELLQALLPTRSSDVTDIITNTLGTVIGMMLCRSSFAQSLLSCFWELGSPVGEADSLRE